jgi:hypothetical protein
VRDVAISLEEVLTSVQGLVLKAALKITEVSDGGE